MTIELGQDWKLDEYGDIAVAWALDGHGILMRGSSAATPVSCRI